MLRILKDDLTDSQYAVISMLLEGLDDIYRFSGKYHQVSRPNSVKDHVNSLMVLVGDIFDDLPLKYAFLRKDMLMRAVLHDMGELLGEFDILENVIDGSKLSSEKKKEYESIVFSYFLYQAHLELNTLYDYKHFYDLLNKLRRILSDSNTEDFIASLKARVDRYETRYPNDMLKILKYYNHIEHDASYAGRIFKALDLIDGNEFYVSNPKDPRGVPKRQIESFKKYCDDIIQGLVEADLLVTEDHTDLTHKVISRLRKTVNNYLKLVS